MDNKDKVMLINISSLKEPVLGYGDYASQGLQAKTSARWQRRHTLYEIRKQLKFV
jgi:hypothetical protein